VYLTFILAIPYKVDLPIIDARRGNMYIVLWVVESEQPCKVDLNEFVLPLLQFS